MYSAALRNLESIHGRSEIPFSCSVIVDALLWVEGTNTDFFTYSFHRINWGIDQGAVCLVH